MGGGLDGTLSSEVNTAARACVRCEKTRADDVIEGVSGTSEAHCWFGLVFMGFVCATKSISRRDSKGEK